MQPLDRVLETALYVDDLPAAERFYGGVLGLELDSRKEGAFAFFKVGRAMLLLFDPATASAARGGVPAHGAVGPGHACFAVAGGGAGGLARRLEAAGVAIEHEQAWPRGGRSLYFRDPAGNSLELATPRIWGCRDRGGPAAVTLQDPGRPLAPSAAPASSLPVVRLVADLACPWCYVGLHRLLALAPASRSASSGTRSCSTRTCRPAASRARCTWSGSSAVPPRPTRSTAAQPRPPRRRGWSCASTASGSSPTRGWPTRSCWTPAPPAELVSALFAAFFRDGSDLGDPEVLAALGRRLGFDVPEPAAAAARVGAMHEAACRAGIDGVPVFVFGEDHVIAGAQPSECLAALLRLERYRVSGRRRGRRRSGAPGLVVADRHVALPAAALVAGRQVGVGRAAQVRLVLLLPARRRQGLLRGRLRAVVVQPGVPARRHRAGLHLALVA
jgi:catechol 2,3-dioxygenase-like lactoylglutathione lyase family enzyme